MLKPRIQKYFEQNPDLRALFLFDSEGVFTEEIETLQVEGVRFEKFANNFFYLKKQLHTEWLNEKVFLYFPMTSPHKTGKYLEFPLLDILEANKELVTDDEESFLEEFKLGRNQKNLVKKYIKELQYSAVQEVCRPILEADKLDESSLQQGLISAFLKFNKIASWGCILGKLFLLTPNEKESDLKRFLKKLNDNQLFPVLSKKLKFYFGSEPDVIDSEYLILLLQKIRYNQITHWIAEANKLDPYSHLKIREKSILTAIFQLLQEASQHPQINGKLTEMLDFAGKTIHGDKLVEAYGIDAEYGLLSSDMAWRILTAQAETLDYNPRAVIQKLEALYAAHDFEPSIGNTLKFMVQMAETISQINSIPSFTLNKPDEYIQMYASNWNGIDRTYRKAIDSYREISELPDHFDLDRLYQTLNKKYDTFLEKSNREWLKCLQEFGFNYKAIKAPKQYDFYSREIENSSVKTVVIISDALRYEAAYELLGIMHGDDKNVAEIGFQIASIPSKTSVGMSQLLPRKDIRFNEGKITIDGYSTEGIENRQQILRFHMEDAIAIQYNTVESMPLKDSREIFKAPLVYVYHDVIDATGDKKSSERRTFKAVEEAITELGKFVNKVHHTYNVTRVFITSDHGFIYNDQEVEEKDKEPGSVLESIASHNRYELLNKEVNPKLGYCFPIKVTTAFKDGGEVFVLTPESTNRYKKQGVGHQFVHGGGSLQELVVPVINSYRKIQAIAKKVRPLVTNESQLRIVSNILRVTLLQEKKISRTEKELELVIALYKGNQLVSNDVVVKLDSSSDSPTDRIHKVELILNSSAIKETHLKLKAFDIEERLNPIIEILVQNQTIIATDF